LDGAPSTKDHYSKTLSPSQLSAIRDTLTHLSDIEAAATALQRNTASFKNNINVSHSTLDSLLLNCYSLQASLSKVTLKAAPVTAVKEDVSEVLSKVKVQLEALKSELVKKQKLERQPAASAPVYPTGMGVH
jgi:iron-sulfur cluster repair protein YtfE (RIC family)